MELASENGQAKKNIYTVQVNKIALDMELVGST